MLGKDFTILLYHVCPLPHLLVQQKFISEKKHCPGAITLEIVSLAGRTEEHPVPLYKGSYLVWLSQVG